MKLLVSVVTTLFASVWIALLFRDDQGYAMLRIGSWIVETSVVFLLIISIMLLIASYILVRIIVNCWRLPSLTAKANHQWHLEKAQHLFAVGTRQMATGNSIAAERTLLKAAAHSNAPAQYYINAARATNQSSDSLRKQRRDLHLSMAEECASAEDMLEVQLTRVEFLLDDQETEQARIILETLHTLNPYHPDVLRFLSRTYQKLRDWESIKNLLPELKKRKVLDLKTFIELKNRTYLGLLENATVHGSPDKLRVLWKQVTCDDDNVALLVDYYATALCKCGAILDAEALLRQAIQRCWDTRLVIRYGMLRTRNDMALQLLTNAERWLVQHNNDPYLLLTLGRLSKYCKHLEKARGYLEMSVKLMPTPAAYKELGELAEALQELQYASQCFHAGLEIITDNSWTVGSA